MAEVTVWPFWALALTWPGTLFLSLGTLTLLLLILVKLPLGN